jgi:cardiolipin synthase
MKGTPSSGPEFTLDHILKTFIIIFSVTVSVISACHALIMKRDPRSSLGWVAVSLLLPIFGPLLYWSMGINRISRRARRWLERGLRLVGRDTFRAMRETESAIGPPPEAAHLSELRTLANNIVLSPITACNMLVPLENGEQAYPSMLEAIGNARHSVHLSTYIFDGDDTGRRFIDALKSAAGRGVEVRVIIDGLGEKYSYPTARKLLRNSGVKVVRFLPFRQGGRLNLRNHRKILVTDGQVCFTGGMNIGDRHMVERTGRPAPVKDMHFRVEGPVVAELQKIFLEDWFFVTGELLDDRLFFPRLQPAGTAQVRAVGDGPDKEHRKLHWMILGALSCARRRVQIMTPYLIPDRAMIASLATTAMRGIPVTIILPGKNNLPYVHWASRAYLWELLECGIRIFYQPPPFVHSKLFLVDDVWSLIGSANLDPRSLRLNFELNLEVYDRDFTERLERHFQAALAVSREVTLEEVDGRPLPERLRDGVAKLFSPYL